MKKQILLLILFLGLIQFVKGQENNNSTDDKTVTLTVTGNGKTQDEARQKALRSAIEQAFGAFISTKTEILNDSLLKDEIVSVANGNIQKYEIINEVLLPNNTNSTTLKATVSIGKLTTYCQSKGINSEFKGGLFATNIAMQELNEKNEIQGVENLYQVFTELLPKCLDYKIIPIDPVYVKDKWGVQIKISMNINKNYDALSNLIFQFIRSISLNETEVNSYKSLKKPVYALKIHRDKSFEGLSQTQLVIDTFYVRNINTYNTILSFPYTILKYIISNLKYNNSIETHNLFTYSQKYVNFDDHRCLIKLDSKMLFYKYLGGYLKDYNKYMLEYSTSIFLVNSKVISDGSPKWLCNSFEGFNGSLYINLNNPQNDEDEINANWFKGDLTSKVIIPGEPIFNLHGHSNKEFLNINISEYFTIEELKKITEYKVEPIK
jgi:hypothetical protein